MKVIQVTVNQMGFEAHYFNESVSVPAIHTVQPERLLAHFQPVLIHIQPPWGRYRSRPNSSAMTFQSRKAAGRYFRQLRPPPMRPSQSQPLFPRGGAGRANGFSNPTLS